VCGFPVYRVLQGAIWPSEHDNVQEGKVATQLSLHGESDTGMDVTELANEVLQLFESMGPDHECVIQIREPTYGFVGCSECHLLKVFHDEAGNDR